MASMPRGSSLADVIILVVICVVILAVGIAVSNQTAQQTIDESNGERVQTAAVFDGGNGWVSLGTTTGTNETVVTSRGYAINLTGAADSYVETTERVTLASDDTWTVSVWARVDQAASSDNMTALNAGGDLVITYNGSTSEWRAWYYDDGSRNSHTLSVNANEQPSTWANLMVTSDGQNVTLYRNNTQSDTVNASTANISPAPVNNTNFDGRLEEIDTFDDELNNSERSAIVADPVAPYPGNNRTVRVMFDEPYRDQQYVFYTDARMNTYNATFSQGFPGEVMQSSDHLLGADYVWNPDGPRIRPTDGGELANAPVAYVDYDESTVGPGSILPQANNALMLAGLVPVILIVGFIIMRMQNSR